MGNQSTLRPRTALAFVALVLVGAAVNELGQGDVRLLMLAGVFVAVMVIAWRG